VKTYSVNATVCGSKHLGIFRANSEEEAIEMAVESNGHVSLCHQCSGECEDPEITEITAEVIK
jgi:hypothetical protein